MQRVTALIQKARLNPVAPGSDGQMQKGKKGQYDVPFLK
jgi:hypothetical protein